MQSNPPRRPTDRTFGLVFAALFALVAGLVRLHSGHVPVWALVLSGGLAGLALGAPGVLMPFNRLWVRLGLRIAAGVNLVLLGAFFYGVVLPIGLAARLFGLSSLRRAPDPRAATYWSAVPRQAGADTYPDLF